MKNHERSIIFIEKSYLKPRCPRLLRWEELPEKLEAALPVDGAPDARPRKRTLFVDIDNVVSRSADRVRRWKGKKKAYSAAEVQAFSALRQYRRWEAQSIRQVLL